MNNYLCIHGHFYQPPREDPWMDDIFPEPSAAPFSHWNERICRESYAPLAWARRMDHQGNITHIVNCYELMSFNFGPTLMRWLERFDHLTYERIVEADVKSRERFGKGNAIAQVCHHIILPLATQDDKKREVAWGIQDFEHRYGRLPEGMWLSEAAVDTPTLEVLAEMGIEFTMLAPRQAKAISPLGQNQWHHVAEYEVDIRRPYRVQLPSGRSIAVFFYHGPLSQAVAFERLLENGDNFLNRLTGDPSPGIRALATDGETYGHHFQFGEMALAYALEEISKGHNGWTLTNFASFLETHPPEMDVQLHEPSSWSCIHGVGRWSADCGCTDGGHPNWNQRWRAPLRGALNLMKEKIDGHYAAAGKSLFSDAEETLLDYGRVYAGSVTEEAFEASHFNPGLDDAERDKAWKLLSMQQWALSSLASCAWFFDDIGRLEPLNGLTYAARAHELALRTGCRDFQPEMLALLREAESNMDGVGTGEDLWNGRILRRRENTERLAAQGLLTLWAERRFPIPDETAVVEWPGVKLTFTVDSLPDGEHFSGTMEVRWHLESGSERFIWSMNNPGEYFNPVQVCFNIREEHAEVEPNWCYPGGSLPWKKLQSIAVKWAKHSEYSVFKQVVRLCRSGTHMFLPWEEAQHDQTAGYTWARMYSGLAWNYCMGELDNSPGRKDFVRFVRERTERHSSAPLVARRVVEEALRVMQEQDDPEGAADMINRARDIGLPLDLWPAQNALWQVCPDDVKWAKLAKILGFAYWPLSTAPVFCRHCE